MLIDATDGKHYYYEDEFMYFSFDGINSRKYRLFIVNDKKGFNWYTSTGASVKVEKPLYQNYTYYTGTDRSQKKMDLNVAAEGLTDAEIKDMFVWLEEGRTGFLTVDWNMDWGYDVVLASVSNAEMLGHGYKSVLTFKLTFQTIGEFKARGAWTISNDSFSNNSTIANSYGIPEIDIQGANIYIPMVGNAYEYIDYSNMVDYGNRQLIIKDTTKSSQYVTYVDCTYYTAARINVNYYGRSGYILVNHNQLLENANDVSSVQMNPQETLLRLSGQGPIKATFNKSGSIISFSQEDRDKMNQIGYCYISISKRKTGNFLSYNVDTFETTTTYPIEYENYDLRYVQSAPYSINVAALSNVPASDLLVYYGEYHCLQIDDSSAANPHITIHKYNNL